LFEPFQTTKELTGTGLGLWVSKGIVEKHGGHMTVKTSRDERSHGTVFTVWLPLEGSANLVPQEY
jgi:signal transduction histidine kinase